MPKGCRSRKPLKMSSQSLCSFYFLQWVKKLCLGAVVYLFVLFGSTAFSQEDNALPPGPARMHGTLFVNGTPYENAPVLFFYTRNGQTDYARYSSNASGRFTVYVYDDAHEPLVAIMVENKLRIVFEPKDFLPGANYYHTFEVDDRKTIKLDNKKYRKILRKLYL